MGDLTNELRDRLTELKKKLLRHQPIEKRRPCLDEGSIVAVEEDCLIKISMEDFSIINWIENELKSVTYGKSRLSHY